MSQKTSWWCSWEITIDSNWITTIAMAILLLIFGASLISEIRHYVYGSMTLRVLHTNQFFTNVANIIITVGFLIGAFETNMPIPARLAFLSMGIDFASRFALGYLQILTQLQHFIAISDSILRQIALILALITIFQWFKSVCRWTPPSHMGKADS